MNKAFSDQSSYAGVRADVARLSPILVGRVALEKTGPRYRGLIESGGRLFRFSLSGDGFFVNNVEDSDQSAAWVEFHRLEEAESRLNERT